MKNFFLSCFGNLPELADQVGFHRQSNKTGLSQMHTDKLIYKTAPIFISSQVR